MLFSTHYHELVLLDKTLKHLKNVHVDAKESKGGVVFLHKVLDGGADKSYGINVASLAGLPRSLIERSKRFLKHLRKIILHQALTLIYLILMPMRKNLKIKRKKKLII